MFLRVSARETQDEVREADSLLCKNGARLLSGFSVARFFVDHRSSPKTQPRKTEEMRENCGARVCEYGLSTHEIPKSFYEYVKPGRNQKLHAVPTGACSTKLHQH